ncbi:MAG: LAGLIDADG family homing endonuclease [Bacillota bacterium]|nr:LAGLIDADG family homing endonuclease [Bacillota bacterium]
MSRYKNEDKYKLAIEELNTRKVVTLTFLSNKYGFDKASFSRYLKKNGYDIKKTGRAQSKIDMYNFLGKEYLQGKSLKSLSKKYGVSRKSLSRYLKEIGFQIKCVNRKDYIVVDENFFETIDTEEKAYWLGFIFADGCAREYDQTYSLRIEIKSDDKKHLEKFKSSLGLNAEIKQRKNRKTVSVTISRKKLVKDLWGYGCVENKTNKGFIKNIPSKFLRHFFRGFFDGDGYIEKDYNKYRASLVVKSEDIANFIKFHLSSFITQVETDGNFYRIHIGRKDEFFNFVNYLYKDSTIYLDRKYATYKSRVEYVN